MSENKKRGSLFDEIVGVKQPTINRAVQASMEDYYEKHGNFGGLDAREPPKPSSVEVWSVFGQPITVEETDPAHGNPPRQNIWDELVAESQAKVVTVEPKQAVIAYLFDEDKYLAEVKAHVDKTYSGHYSGQYQATSVIIDAGHGTGFNVGNIIKYAKRYGKKDGYNKADLMKIIHYALMQMYVQDTEKL